MEEREELLRELSFTPIMYDDYVKNYWNRYYQKYNEQQERLEEQKQAKFEMLMTYIKK